jgi:hypothetical protein
LKTTSKRPNPKQAREDLLAAARAKQIPADPFSRQNLRALAIRVGIPAVILWIIAIAIPGWIPKAVVGTLTLAVLGVLLWALRFARKSRAVADIVREADSPEARKDAIGKLAADYKKDDAAAVFAKAQLELQDNRPRDALATLETIKLEKVMAPTADEARVQRAMIHLLLSETDEARALADGIDMSRHKDPKTRGTMAAIIGEALARTGQAKRAVEMLETFDPSDEAYKDLGPQLLRARAFAYAWASDGKQMKQTLRKLSSLNPQYLTGFITKKKHPGGVGPRGVHPLLEKEAYEMMSRSGLVQRRMEVKRG